MKDWKKIGIAAAGISLAQTTPLWSQQEVPLKPFFAEEGNPVVKPKPVPAETAPAPVPVPAPAPEPKPAPIPEEPVVPVATPLPVKRATAPSRLVATPRPLPKATPIPQPEMHDPTDEIRITPQGTMRPEQVQLSIGDSFYTRKAYDQAAPEYEKYLGLYPSGVERPSVYYRLGESYRATGALNASKSSYESVINQFPDHELAGPATYRLAELYYQEKNYASALPLYRRAIGRLKDPKLSNSAKFFTGRCLEALGQKMDARFAYEDLLNSPEENPFLEASRLSLAVLLKDAGRTIEALKHIQVLSQRSTNLELKAQSTVYAGVWEVELGQTARAEEDLKRALQMPEVGRWKDVAQLGLLQLYFAAKKYQQVVDAYDSASKDFGPDTRPQLLNLVAMSMRQLGKNEESLAILQQLAKESPGSVYGKEAAYERLAVLYSTNAAGLIGEINQFLAANPDNPKNDQVLLMKAETLFKKQDYPAAAPIYAQFESSRTLSGSLKGEALAKLGWCLMQTKEYDKAIKAYTALLSGYPTVKSLPSALCQRGLARLRVKDLAGALKDFDELNSRYPKAKERELSLQQKALIQGQMNNNAAMAATFRQLLKAFPKTPVAAEANYWIGWVAFEAKDYKAVIEPLDKARQLDKEQYFERASLRIMLSHFYLENKEALAREIDFYIQSGIKRPVPYEVIHWLGKGYYEAAAAATEDTEARLELYRKASRFLTMLISRDDVKPEDFLNLGRSDLSLSKFLPARESLEKYLALTKEPGPRSIGLLALGHAQIGLKALDDAQKSAAAVFALQPDGELNAWARTLAGDIQQARGNFEEAAKVYESVGVVIDDENVTPQALEKAIEAYKAAGRDTDAKRLLNTLQSRYPEYFQRKNAHP